MNARFACPACQTAICIPQLLSPGTAVRCPKCKHVFPCPAEPVTQAITATAPPPVATLIHTPLVDTLCPGCGFKGQVPDSLIGKSVKCRQCSTVFGVAVASAEPLTDVEVLAQPVEPARPRSRRKVPLPLILGGVSLAVFLLISVVALYAFNRTTSNLSAQPKPSPIQSTALKREQPVAQAQQPALPAKLQPPAAPQLILGFDDWMQDLEAAKARAAREKKDILILFDGSDWCGWSIRLASAVFFQSEFKYEATQKFVLVFIDFPRRPDAMAKVQNPARNERLAQQYGITGFPTVVLTDAQGMPYATEGYLAGGPRDYLARLALHQQTRIQRDQLLAGVQGQNGIAKLIAAKKAYEYLQQTQLLPQYEGMVQSWYQLAKQHDPKNEDAFVEFFFEATWLPRMQEFHVEQPAPTIQWASQLDEWKKTYQFRDPNRGASLHLAASMMMTGANRPDLSRRYLEGAVACKPTDPLLKQRLADRLGK